MTCALIAPNEQLININTADKPVYCLSTNLFNGRRDVIQLMFYPMNDEQVLLTDGGDVVSELTACNWTDEQITDAVLVLNTQVTLRAHNGLVLTVGNRLNEMAVGKSTLLDVMVHFLK